MMSRCPDNRISDRRTAAKGRECRLKANHSEKDRARVRRALQKAGLAGVTVGEQNGSLLLTGTLARWDDVVRAGQIAAARRGSYAHVVNHLDLPGAAPAAPRLPALRDAALDGLDVDVAVIGAGVTGCAIARELSRWDLSVLLLEKEDDVAVGASSRNDGMIHPGIDLRRSTQKFRYGVSGNAMFDQLAGELEVPFVRNGSYIIFSAAWERLLVPAFYLRAALGHIPGVRYVSRRALRAREPAVADWARGAIYTGSSGILCPYGLTLALAENAVQNGVRLSLSTAVTGFVREGSRLTGVVTNRGTLRARLVIDAAGVWADRVAALAGDEFFTIHPRKGTSSILDRRAGALTASVLAKAPFADVRNHTKGGGIVRTIDGNLLVGPTAREVREREDNATALADIDAEFAKHSRVAPGLTKADVITYFSGTRAATYEEDFIVGKSPRVENLLYAAGIQSPGLTAAPAIAAEIARLAVAALSAARPVRKNPHFDPHRKAVPRPREMDDAARAALIAADPDFGEVICRCEGITRGEILAALRSPVPARSLDGVKRRVRAGMGRCQGGFCSPVVAELLAKEQHIPLWRVQKGGCGSDLGFGPTKGGGGSAQRTV